MKNIIATILLTGFVSTVAFGKKGYTVVCKGKSVDVLGYGKAKAKAKELGCNPYISLRINSIQN